MVNQLKCKNYNSLYVKPSKRLPKRIDGKNISKDCLIIINGLYGKYRIVAYYYFPTQRWMQRDSQESYTKILAYQELLPIPEDL
jgi:hypothetical protein